MINNPLPTTTAFSAITFVVLRSSVLVGSKLCPRGLEAMFPML